ncbi:class I SAM-dependent methyltransferase [Brevundimonas subvibrioides]|uniref:Methyltransferase type 12 n=1 Tax=Brevundimonas subvibrioides (strain ATCC 15264 / DSM 4735 / LMG 14903 / NBRC 16000 / CB 81) TaxID=633149 RepID=D9QL20_BRESC|nr:class I SAM-dependent methyltransferase [Brevundimonas subvibrioides]ADK99875.1 Methyltransferase type 12 [Brevundimonas subvibrioides ATCC 15264]
MSDPARAAAAVVDLYDRRADDWIVDRGVQLTAADRLWLDRFTATLAPGDPVLDVGSGSGRPMAAALLERGLDVTGVETSARLVTKATQDLPSGRFLQADMRTLHLGRTFAGILAWHSLFHLTPEDQRLALPRLLAHAAPRSVVMFSSGHRLGHEVGEWHGEPLYHGSLDAAEYDAILAGAGFSVEQGVWADDGSVWLARRDG